MVPLVEDGPDGLEAAGLDEEGQKEYWAALALRHCPGLGARGRRKLMEFFGSAAAAVEHPREWREAGASRQAPREFKSGKWRPDARKEWDSARKTNPGLLLWTSPAYPRILRALVDAPILLYFAGNPALLNAPAVAIVGSREASPESLGIAASLSRSLSSSGIAVVSGMAAGIDGSAHHAAVSEIGGSIGVLGTGINVEYPYSNRGLYAKMRARGLLLSEFPPDAAPVPRNFPIRNRIISGLSLGVVVVEAAERSGSLVTARLALEQGREVFAVPGKPLSNESVGCQNLMRDGAHPVFNVDDILLNLQDALKGHCAACADARPMSGKAKGRGGAGSGSASQAAFGLADVPNAEACLEAAPKQDEAVAGKEVALEHAADDRAQVVLDCLRKRGPMHVDALAEAAGISAVELNSLLVFMELLGQARRLDGARYEAL